MAKVLDYCLEVYEFELQSHYDIPFHTNIFAKSMDRYLRI